MLAQVHEQLPQPKMLDKGQSFDPPIRRPGHYGGGTNLRIQHILLSSRHVSGVTRPSVVSTGAQTVSWYLDQGHWRKARSGVAYTVAEADQWTLTCFFFRPANSHVPEEGSAVQEEHLGKELQNKLRLFNFTCCHDCLVDFSILVN